MRVMTEEKPAPVPVSGRNGKAEGKMDGKGIDAVVALLEQVSSRAGRCEVLRLADLKVDRDNYQRGEQRYVRKIAKQFNPEACPPLLVGRRSPGGDWVIDGQQRRAALLSLKVEEWPCMVVASRGPAHEAEIFTVMNGGRGTVVKVQSRDLFRGLLAAGDPLAVAAKGAAERAGFLVPLTGAHRAHGAVTCYSFLLQAVKSFGEQKLERAMRLVRAAWPESPDAVRIEVLAAVINLIGHHGERVEDARFVRLLSEFPALTIYQEAKATGRDGRLSGYAAVARRYNKHLQYKVPESLSPERNGG